MNNTKIKIVSVIILLFFTGSFAIPFFVQENCDMTESNSSTMHFDIDMSDRGCCETMIECIVVPMHPIVTAPLNNVNLQKDLTVDYKISYSDNFNFIDDHSFHSVIDMLCYSEGHHGFQIPLLV